jgi:lysophospholipid acyltransferase (LPLAT)-like uncharacterized protein
VSETTGSPAPAASPDAVARDAARERKRARRVRWSVRIGLLVIRALAATWRFRIVGRERIDAMRARGEPFILAFWHGRMLPLLWSHRGQGISILVSEHGDGEIIARIAAAVGLNTVRGSSSRGAERALLGMIRTVQEGGEVAITPDGPRGPLETFAPGAAIIAQRSGAPIVPLAAGADRAWRLKSWDRFLIPKPFARVTVSYGEPWSAAGLSAREASARAPELEALLRAHTAAVDG